jgi:hypothetical protein
MGRIIISPEPFRPAKERAGDWFKKTYGHELGEDGMTQVEKKKQFEQDLKQHKEDNL